MSNQSNNKWLIVGAAAAVAGLGFAAFYFRNQPSSSTSSSSSSRQIQQSSNEVEQESAETEGEGETSTMIDTIDDIDADDTETQPVPPSTNGIITTPLSDIHPVATSNSVNISEQISEEKHSSREESSTPPSVARIPYVSAVSLDSDSKASKQHSEIETASIPPEQSVKEVEEAIETAEQTKDEQVPPTAEVLKSDDVFPSLTASSEDLSMSSADVVGVSKEDLQYVDSSAPKGSWANVVALNPEDATVALAGQSINYQDRPKQADESLEEQANLDSAVEADEKPVNHSVTGDHHDRENPVPEIDSVDYSTTHHADDLADAEYLPVNHSGVEESTIISNTNTESETQVDIPIESQEEFPSLPTTTADAPSNVSADVSSVATIVASTQQIKSPSTSWASLAATPEVSSDVSSAATVPVPTQQVKSPATSWASLAAVSAPVSTSVETASPANGTSTTHQLLKAEKSPALSSTNPDYLSPGVAALQETSASAPISPLLSAATLNSNSSSSSRSHTPNNEHIPASASASETFAVPAKKDKRRKKNQHKNDNSDSPAPAKSSASPQKYATMKPKGSNQNQQPQRATRKSSESLDLTDNAFPPLSGPNSASTSANTTPLSSPKSSTHNITSAANGSNVSSPSPAKRWANVVSKQ